MFQAGHLQGFWAGGLALSTYPAYNSAGTANAVTATPVSPTYPAVASGNFLILVVIIGHSTSTPSVTTPAGWTAITGGSDAMSSGADRTGLFTFYKVSDGTETGALAVTVSMAGASNVALARIYRYTSASGIEGGASSGNWQALAKDPCIGNYGDYLDATVAVTGTKRLCVQIVGMDNDYTSGVAVPSGFAAATTSVTTTGGDAGIVMTTKQIDALYNGGNSLEIISAGGNLNNDAGFGFTIGFALIGV